MLEDAEVDDNDLLEFSPVPLLNSTMADTSATEDSKENINSVQYITERLIKKIAHQENLWMIKTLNLTLTKKGTYIKKIKRIENLENVKELEELSLNHNVIEKIENVEHLKKLHVLNLSHNMISKIENISSLVKLEVLDLSHNQISILPYRIFKHLQRIKKLDVSHNNIAEIKQIRDMRLLGNLIEFSFHDNPVVSMAPHATDTAVFYLRGLQLLDGSPVTSQMRSSADKRYQQEEVNAMQDEILDKSRMIDAVSKEREEVIKALEDKKVVEEKLRKSGNNSMLKIVDLEDELTNTKQLLEQRTSELTTACYKHYALEQELSMYKVDARFKDMGPPPLLLDSEVREHTEESGYVSKAPLYPVQYGIMPSGHTQEIEHYRDFDYTEQLADDNKIQLLEQKILDNDREKRNIEKQLADNEKELEEREKDIGNIKERLDEIQQQLSEEARLRRELETELGMKNKEVDNLRNVEGRLRDAETEVDDLHTSLQNKAEEVKDLRNKLALAKPKGIEREHMQARLEKKEDDLERERMAYEDAKREFQKKQKELQQRSSPRPDSRLRIEHDALLQKLDDLEKQLGDADEERQGLERELDAVKRDEDSLRRDVSIVQKMFADKETETDALHGELDKTRDQVSMLKHENRKLKDEAVQLLDCSTHPENEVLQETLDELEGVQTENARLVRERSVHSPFLTREALRRSRDKLADLEDENAELRNILNDSRGEMVDPDDIARRILKFLEDRLPKTPAHIPTTQNIDLIPIIKLLLEERDKKRETPSNPQDLVKLLEDLIKERSTKSSPTPVINVNVPEQSPRRADSVISDRYLRSSSPCRISSSSPRIYIHDPREEDVIHLVSRRAQTDQDATINLGESRQKRKRVVITDRESETCGTEADILILDKRRDQATNTNIHILADEMLNKFERSTRDRDQSEKDKRETERERNRIDKLMEEVASLKQGIREATTQTNVHVLDSVQRRLDDALTRTNSLDSCGHEELISYLKSNLAVAEKDVDQLRDLLHERDVDQETALTEMKIDGLGETLRDHNRSLHNLQEVLRDAMTSRDPKHRDVIFQPPDSQTSVEIRDIQKTLMELQYSLKYATENQNKSEKSVEHHHSTQCLHCVNCKKNDVDLELELRKVRQELSDSKLTRVEGGDLEKLREGARVEREELEKLKAEQRNEKSTIDKLRTEARGEKVGLEKLRTDHTTILIDMERIRAERNHINDVLVQYKTQLEDVEHDKRARYHELLEINERVAQSERSAAETQAAEKRALDALQLDAHDLKKTISELNLQREHMVREAAQTQQQLKQDKQAFEDEMSHKKKLFEHTALSTNIRKEEELAHLDSKVRDRASQLDKLEEDLRDRNECLHRLRLEVDQSTKQHDILQMALDGEINKKNEEISQQEVNIKHLGAQLDDVNERKEISERQLKANIRDISSFQETLKQLESEKEEKEMCVKSMAQKLKQTQSKLSNAKHELDDVLRESENAKVDSSRQQEVLSNLAAEIASISERKHRRKEKLKQLELESEQLEKAIRDKKTHSSQYSGRKIELEKDVKELELLHKQHSENVDSLTDDMRKLERQKQDELLKLGELKSSFELIKSKREQLQELYTADEERIREAINRMDDQKFSLENTVKTLQQKVHELDADIFQKSESISRLSEEEERTRSMLAELELSRVTATNELDDHLTSAVKEKYALSTAITALKREKETLKIQHDKISEELGAMRTEATALRDTIIKDKVECEQLGTSCHNAEQQYKDYCNLSEQAVQQMNTLQINIVTVEKDLHSKRGELREVGSKQEEVQTLLQDRQDKLSSTEQKLMTYNQRISNTKTTLENNQDSISKMANKKLELENELSAVKREIDALEGSKYRYNEELVAQRQALENLRKDLTSCQKQHKQEMAKYNKLMREKNKYDAEGKAARDQCEAYAKNIDRMKGDEVEMKDRMKCLARDLGVVSQDYREKCASLKSVEELKSQTCFLDNEIKQKSEVLSQYNDKLDEINKLKERALEKEHLLKDSEIKVSNLQNQINEVVKMSEEKQSSDDITTNGLKKTLKKLRKHLQIEMDSSTLVRMELAEQTAAARTLELDLQAQRDAHNSVLSMLEEDNSALHSKCEEQLLEIETLRLELAASHHSLGSKQAELTFIVEDVFDRSVHEDIDTKLTAIDSRDRHELMSDLNTSYFDRTSGDFSPSKRWRGDRRVVDNINYKFNQIDTTVKHHTLDSPLRTTTGTLGGDTCLLKTEESLAATERSHVQTNKDTDKTELSDTGHSTFNSYKPVIDQNRFHGPSSPDRQAPASANNRDTPLSDQGYLTDNVYSKTEKAQWFDNVI